MEDPDLTKASVAQLPRALELLATEMRQAVADRRMARPGSDRYRRADDRAAYLNQLFLRLQHRMEIPAEIWHLGQDGGHPWGSGSRRRARDTSARLSRHDSVDSHRALR